MDSYTSFAYVYDTFMDQEPYDMWADRVCACLEKYGLPNDIKKAGSVNTDPETGLREQPEDRAECSGDRMENSPESGPQGQLQEYAADCPGEQEESDPGDALSAEQNIVVDLGCGTGKLTELLAARGYDMIGIDLSEDMLAIAQERKIESGSDILYTLQDMRDFELYGAAGAMVSVGDSINYLLEEEDLAAMFRCVFRGLLPGGVFVFDFKTIHLYRDEIGDRTIAEDRGDCAFIWDNYYDPETCINEYDLAVFVRQEGADGTLFRRFDETHRQRGYTPDQLRTAAESAGLAWIAMQDVDSGGAVGPQTERAMAAVRKPRL